MKAGIQEEGKGRKKKGSFEAAFLPYCPYFLIPSFRKYGNCSAPVIS